MGGVEFAGVYEMKVAVYTCITDGYDELRSPRVLTKDVDYLCFNDGSIYVPEPWLDIRTDFPYSGKDVNRYVKILSHAIPQLALYDLTIYIDGAIEIVGDLAPLIKHVISANGHTFLYEHPSRTCVYREARACVESMKAPIAGTIKLMEQYRKEGMPKNYGLFEGGIIARKKDKKAERLMDKWWETYLNDVKRDQLALIYSSWKTSVAITSLGLPDHRIEKRYFCCNSGHNGDIIRRYFAWWIWRPVTSALIDCKLIKL